MLGLGVWGTGTGPAGFSIWALCEEEGAPVGEPRPGDIRGEARAE